MKEYVWNFVNKTYGHKVHQRTLMNKSVAQTADSRVAQCEAQERKASEERLLTHSGEEVETVDSLRRK